jgi:uncharacterized protein
MKVPQFRLGQVLALCAVLGLFLALDEPVARAAMQANATSKATILPWKLMRTLDLKTGEATPELNALNGKLVRIAGYMVPLDDDDELAAEFLFVPIAGGCIHTPPPPPNQIVQILMSGARKVQIDMWEPMWVEGTLEIAPSKSPYGMVSFRMKANNIAKYHPQNQ